MTWPQVLTCGIFIGVCLVVIVKAVAEQEEKIRQRKEGKIED